MYIIKTVSKSKKDGTKKYYTFRLMQSLRVGDKVKKITLLNLGSDFNIDQEHWANFSKRIDDIINKTPSLFEFDKDLESQAQQYATRLILLQAKKIDNEQSDTDDNKYKEIDTTSIDNSDSKDIGCEHIIYETIKELELDKKLKDIGFTNVQLNSAIGTIVAKMINPSSDIKTYRWLCGKSGINELLNCNFNKISSNNIYRVADKLYENKDILEKHLYEKQKQIFDYEETITLYDLTNTYFEGSAKGIEKAKRGRSKEKRKCAPLITLAVMLDSSGFVRKSEIFDGNIGEPTTFISMLDKFERGSTILTSNLVFSKWTTIFANDKVVTTAILDRVLHHSHIINIQGDSYRLKEKQELGLMNSDIFKTKEDLTQNSNEN